MIILNLLPPEEKQKIKSAQAQRKILSLGGTGLFLISMFLIFLSSIWLFLAIQQNSAEAIYRNIQANPQNESFKEFENKISQINEKLSYSESLNKESPHYSFALEKLTELAPSDIKFTALSLNQNKASLDGFSANRQALLAFKDALSRSSYFDKVDMPLINFLKQENINFIVNFEIKQ